MEASILHYYGVMRQGWNEIAVISTLFEVTTDSALYFVNSLHEDLSVLTFQQYLVAQETDMSVELQEIKNSGARVIVAFVLDLITLLERAEGYELVDEGHVWVVSDAPVVVPFAQPSDLARGVIGATVDIRSDIPEALDFISLWQNADFMLWALEGLQV